MTTPAYPDTLRSGAEQVFEFPGAAVGVAVDTVRVTLQLTGIGRTMAEDDATWSTLSADISSTLAEEVGRLIDQAIKDGHVLPFVLAYGTLPTLYAGAIEVWRLEVGHDRHAHRGIPGDWFGPRPAVRPTVDYEGVDLEEWVGAEPSDAGAEPPGAGAEPPDAGAEPPDAGAEPPDAGAEPPDAGDESPASGEAGAEPVAEPARYLQCQVGPDDPEVIPDNVLRSGRNLVSAFIGRPRKNFLVGASLAEARVRYESNDLAVLTVRLTPIDPLPATGEAPRPVTATIALPRKGDSSSAPLPWDIPEGAATARAQLAVLQDGAVLMLAELSGTVGERVELINQQEVSGREVGHPERPKTRSVVLDTARDGRPILVDSESAKVHLIADLLVVGTRMCEHLSVAPGLSSTRAGGLDRVARKAMIQVARDGALLRGMLEDWLEGWAASTHLQVVTAGTPLKLPLELIYDLPSPNDDAVLCPTWVAGGACGPACGGANPHGIVCPAAFWGVSRVIERHYWYKGDDDAWLCEPVPEPHQRLDLSGVLLAASVKVTDAYLAAAALDGVPRCTTWDDWCAHLAEGDRKGLLVLLPENQGTSLEVSKSLVWEPDVTAPYVVGNDPARHPFVVLLGCETAGNAQDLFGFATFFLKAGAACVLGTLAPVDVEVAPHLAAIALRVLQEPHPDGRMVGEVMTAVRTAALRENLVTALALTAYGDSRWEV